MGVKVGNVWKIGGVEMVVQLNKYRQCFDLHFRHEEYVQVDVRKHLVLRHSNPCPWLSPWPDLTRHIPDAVDPEAQRRD